MGLWCRLFKCTLLNSVCDFEYYSEIKPIASIGVVLSWTYLIKFKNKLVHEKQSVNLSFRGGNNNFNSIIEDGDFIILQSNKWRGPTGILLRIEHTERTWGVDIESLLTGQVKTFIKGLTKTEIFLSKHNEATGLTVGFLLLLGAIGAVFYTSSSFVESYREKIQELSSAVGSNNSIIESKINFLIDIIQQEHGLVSILQLVFSCLSYLFYQLLFRFG